MTDTGALKQAAQNFSNLQKHTQEKQEMMVLYANAPHSRQITMPVPHHSIFYGPDALPDTQPTVSKH